MFHVQGYKFGVLLSDTIDNITNSSINLDLICVIMLEA